MNKTITINLGGVVFNIEEDAFNRLKGYLERLKETFTSEDGREEIIADIEARMAELFRDKLNDNKSALTLADIDSVILIMGKPEDYADYVEEKPSSANGTDEPHVRNKNRKLYRDGDDAVIGGVCAGFSHFLGWDPSILRIILVLAFFFGGTGFIIYIILWAVIPAAKTRAERLQMKGEPVTVDNLSKMVKDELETFENRYSGTNKKFGSEISSKAREFGQSSGRVLQIIFGGFMVIVALMILLSIIGAFIGLNIGGPFASENFSLSYADTLLFNGDGSLTWLVAVGSVMIVVPLILLLYSGLKMLLGIKKRVPGLGWSLAILFVLGLSASILLGVNVGKQFSRDADNTTRHTLSIDSDTLNIAVSPNDFFPFDIESDEREFFELLKETDNARIYGEPISLGFESTDDDEFSMVIRKSANGASTTQAFQFLERLQYNYSIAGDTTTLDTYFSTPKEDPFRDQRIEIEILVPKGKWISFGQGLQRIYWNGNNVGKTLQMGESTWMNENTLYRDRERTYERAL